MALKDTPEYIEEYLKLVPAVKHSPNRYLWSSYDEGGDVLYIRFQQSGRATDSELTDDDIILRYDGEEMVGITILRASQR